MNDPSSTRRTLRRLRLALWTLAGIGLLLFALLWPRRAAPPADELPTYGQVPAFELTNRDGRTIETATLEGRPWIADFIFTTCPGVCPILTERMAVLDDELDPGAVALVSFSVDPVRDTPEMLAEYAAKHEARDRWLFLTGTEAEITTLVRDGFKLPLDASPRAEGLEPIVHSNRFVLVDDEGGIRGYYNAFDAEALAQLRVDLARLLD